MCRTYDKGSAFRIRPDRKGNRSMRAAISCLLVICIVSFACADLPVPLFTGDSAGVARSQEPVCGGVPLPWNTYRTDQAFAVFASGEQIPGQTVPLVIDEHGFLRWVLVDIQADVPANGTAQYELRTVKTPPEPAIALSVSDTAESVSVDTGVMSFSVARDKPFSLLDTVTAGRPIVLGGQVSYTDTWSGKEHLADRPTSVAIEYAGPLRVTICARGRFVGDEQTKLRYIARITAWAGKSRIHVCYKLSNSNPDHYCYRQVKDSTIALKLAGKVSDTLLGGSQPLAAGPSASLTAGLFSRSAGAARAVNGKKEAWSSKGKSDVAQGWIAARTDGGRVYACDTYFTADPPRALAVRNGKLVLTGATRRFETSDKRGQPFAAMHRVLFDCSHLRSEYILDFQAPREPAQLAAIARGARSPLHLRAAPAAYFAQHSLGIGRIGTQSDEMACYDTWKWTYDKGHAPQSPGKIGTRRFVLYEDNHFETEQDSVEGYVLMYLRTGNRSYFEGGRGWANYEMDRQKWRTDGWQWRDGGVWKRSGPLGNRPQRDKDPVTGQRNYCPGGKCAVLEPGAAGDMYKMSIGSQCRCHNYAAGIAAWYCITGDRDALETAIDSVEQMLDYQKRVRGLKPGTATIFSRDFTRSVYLSNATRLAAPTDPFVVEASDFLSNVYLQRKVKEPRGLVNGARPLRLKGFGAFAGLEKFVGPNGIARMKELGVTFSNKDGQLHDPKTGVRWYPIPKPNSFMLPSIAGGIHSYFVITGNEDAQDWVIAFGKALAHVLWQRHGQQHPNLLVDFPHKGVVKDLASWSLPENNVNGKGFKISGYLARLA